jgi:hypothetical protein
VNAQTISDFWIGPNSASGTGTYAMASNILWPGGNAWGASIAVRKILTLTSLTTVYFETYSSQTITIQWEGVINNAGGVSGITAVRLA